MIKKTNSHGQRIRSPGFSRRRKHSSWAGDGGVDPAAKLEEHHPRTDERVAVHCYGSQTAVLSEVRLRYYAYGRREEQGRSRRVLAAHNTVCIVTTAMLVEDCIDGVEKWKRANVWEQTASIHSSRGYKVRLSRYQLVVHVRVRRQGRRNCGSAIGRGL